MNIVAWSFLAPAVVIAGLLLVGGARKARHMWRVRRARKRAIRVQEWERR